MFKFGTLVVLKKNGNDGSKFPLVTSACILGSDSTCDIRINRVDVAREHCRLDVNKNGQVRLTHIGRSNQTLLNDKSVKSPVLIHHNDIITISDRKFRWESSQVLDEGATDSRPSLQIANQVAKAKRRSVSQFNDPVKQNSSLLRGNTPVGIVTPTRRISTDVEKLTSKRSVEPQWLSQHRVSMTLTSSAPTSRTERLSRRLSAPRLNGSPSLAPSSGRGRRSKSNEETKKTRKSVGKVAVVKDDSKQPADGTKSDDDSKQKVKANHKRRSRSKSKKVIKMRKLEDENAVKILAPSSPDTKKSAALRTIHGFNKVGKLKGKDKKYLVAKNNWNKKKHMVQRSERIRKAAIRLNQMGPIAASELVTLSELPDKGMAEVEKGQGTPPTNISREFEADETTTVKCTTRLRSSSSRLSMMTSKLSFNPSESLTEMFVSPLQTPADKSISLPMQRMILSLSKKKSRRSSLQPVVESLVQEVEVSPNLSNLGPLFKTPISSKSSKLSPTNSAKTLGASPVLKNLRSSASSSSPLASEAVLSTSSTKSPKTAPSPTSAKKTPSPKFLKKTPSPKSLKKSPSPKSPKKVSSSKSSLTASGNSPVIRSLRSSGTFSSPIALKINSPTLLTKSPATAPSPKSPKKASSPTNPKKVSPTRSLRLVLHRKSSITSPKAKSSSNTPVTLRSSTSTSSKSKAVSPKSPTKRSPTIISASYSLRNTPSPLKEVRSTKVKGKFPTKSPKCDYTNVDGVAELFENGKAESPKRKSITDLKSSTSGLRSFKLEARRLKTSPQADYTNMKGVKNLFKSSSSAQKSLKSISKAKTKGLNITPDLRPVFKLPRKSPQADYSNVDGLSHLFPSPKLVSSAKQKRKTRSLVKNPEGRQLRVTQQSPNHYGIDTLFATSQGSDSSPQPHSSKRSRSPKTSVSPRGTPSRFPSRSSASKRSPSPSKAPVSPRLATNRLSPPFSASKKPRSPSQTLVSPQLATSRPSPRSSASKRSPSPSKAPVSPRLTTNRLSPPFSASKKSRSPSQTLVSPRLATSRLSPRFSGSKKSPSPSKTPISHRSAAKRLSPQSSGSKKSPPKTPVLAASPLATDRTSPRRLRSRKTATPMHYTPLSRARSKRVVQNIRTAEIAQDATPTTTSTKQGSPSKQPSPASPKKTPTYAVSPERPPKRDLYFPGGLKVQWKSPPLKSPSPTRVQPIASPIKSPSNDVATKLPKKRGKATPSIKKASNKETVKKSKRQVAEIDDVKPEETPKRGRRGSKLQNDETKPAASPVKEVRSRRGASSQKDTAEIHVSPVHETIKRGQRAVKSRKEDVEAAAPVTESSPAKKPGQRGRKRANSQKDEAALEASPVTEKVTRNTRRPKSQKDETEPEPEASPVKRSRRGTNSQKDEAESEISPVKEIKRTRRGAKLQQDVAVLSPIKEVPAISKRKTKSNKEPEQSPGNQVAPSRRRRVETDKKALQSPPAGAAESPSNRPKKAKKSPSKGKTVGVRASTRNKRN